MVARSHGSRDLLLLLLLLQLLLQGRRRGRTLYFDDWGRSVGGGGSRLMRNLDLGSPISRRRGKRRRSRWDVGQWYGRGGGSERPLQALPGRRQRGHGRRWSRGRRKGQHRGHWLGQLRPRQGLLLLLLAPVSSLLNMLLLLL